MNRSILKTIPWTIKFSFVVSTVPKSLPRRWVMDSFKEIKSSFRELFFPGIILYKPNRGYFSGQHSILKLGKSKFRITKNLNLQNAYLQKENDQKTLCTRLK